MIFGKERRRRIRAVKAAFMNLAYKKAVTIPGTWGTPPTTYANLTDEKHLTHFTVDGVTTTTLADKVQIKIDLGQRFEAYVIDVLNIVGTGLKTNNVLNAGTVKMQTSLDGAAWTTRATQTPATLAFVDADLSYNGEGIPVRYIRLYLENDDTYTMTIDISDIEVLGS